MYRTVLFTAFLGLAVTLGCSEQPIAPELDQAETADANWQEGLDPEVAAALAELSDSEREAALEQGTCPVTGMPLGSMGKPYAVDVAGQTVFLCCEGCEAKIKADPEKYLSAEE